MEYLTKKEEEVRPLPEGGIASWPLHQEGRRKGGREGRDQELKISLPPMRLEALNFGMGSIKLRSTSNLAPDFKLTREQH